jgi:hypothetical protein
MDRLIDEIAPSCARHLFRTQTISRSSMRCRGLSAISQISPFAQPTHSQCRPSYKGRTARKNQVTFKRRVRPAVANLVLAHQS